MRKSIVLLAAMSALIATPASAETLWQNFRAGMTIDEVRAADARVAVNPQAAREKLRDGAACELVIDQVQIDAQAFRSCFYFREGRLVQVSLGGADANPQKYRGVVTAMRKAHGPDFAEAQSGRIYEARWAAADKPSVSLMYIEIGAPTMRIVYEPAGAMRRGRVTQPRVAVLGGL